MHHRPSRGAGVSRSQGAQFRCDPTRCEPPGCRRRPGLPAALLRPGHAARRLQARTGPSGTTTSTARAAPPQRAGRGPSPRPARSRTTGGWPPGGQANDAWIRVALDVGERGRAGRAGEAGLGAGRRRRPASSSRSPASRHALDRRAPGQPPAASPPRVKRTPMFGLGCVGRRRRHRPRRRLRPRLPGPASRSLVSVELCSLTLQREDLSVPNLIATGLFGDGAAAVVWRGSSGRRPGRGCWRPARSSTRTPRR